MTFDDRRKHDLEMEAMSSRQMEDDFLERTLNAAIAKYAAIEPRAGLEDRILTNLLSQVDQPAVSWLRPIAWESIAVALLAIGMVAAISILLPSVHRQPIVEVQHPPAVRRHADVPIDTQPTAKPAPLAKETMRKQFHPVAASIAAPHMETFPSPQPLSQQERILERYVNNYPADAALVAEARTEALRRNAEEEMKYSTAKDEQDSPQ